jgi:hypothetical protein
VRSGFNRVGVGFRELVENLAEGAPGVLAERGAGCLAVEDPSANDDARLIASRLGLEVVGVRLLERAVDAVRAAG